MPTFTPGLLTGTLRPDCHGRRQLRGYVVIYRQRGASARAGCFCEPARSGERRGDLDQAGRGCDSLARQPVARRVLAPGVADPRSARLRCLLEYQEQLLPG